MDSSDIQGFSGRRLWGPNLGTEQELDKHSHPLWDINEIFKDRDRESTESEKEEKSSPKLKEKKEKTKGSPPLNAASIISNTIKPIGGYTRFMHNFLDF